MHTLLVQPKYFVHFRPSITEQTMFRKPKAIVNYNTSGHLATILISVFATNTIVKLRVKESIVQNCKLPLPGAKHMKQTLAGFQNQHRTFVNIIRRTAAFKHVKLPVKYFVKRFQN